MLGTIRFHFLGIVAVVSSLVFHPAHRQNVPSDQCATGVHAIISRGQAGDGETGWDPLNVMVSLQNLILEQIPGSTSLGLPYQYGAQDKFVAVHDGAQLLQNYVTSYLASCPESKVVVVGYSLGACLTMDAICGTSSVGLNPVAALNSTYASSVVGVIVYGDETFIPEQSWNVGTCEIGLGIFPRLDPGSCEPFASSIQSYCDIGDNQCCSPLPLDNNAAHHAYMAKYNQGVVDFIRTRL
ncbi:uncharacterized protein N7482_001673 [Penicillium canariense]|uniref:Cutinase n=1 Tax=Penicillium canariense TaxID=189055 RepID=A0A9W9IK64_9EURO|nr:uncharacterized protein N7482_001673 [Penicillium canariense]KAJ5175796.1 hypothetical protein N7482_001673 [Penicillium canariense]